MIDTRLQLHWAAQIVSSVGRTLVSPRADDSHTSFTWISQSIAGQPLEDGRRAALRVRDLTLILDDHTFPLRGRTFDDGYRFFEELLGRTLTRPPYTGDMPDHPVFHGAPFRPDGDQLASLASMFANAADVLERVRVLRSDAGAGAVTLWPHHFDIATFIDRGNGRFVGVGFVPGDAQYPEPYWYVNAEHRELATLPPLARGFWNRNGWTGAVFVSRDAAEGEIFVKEASAILMAG